MTFDAIRKFQISTSSLSFIMQMFAILEYCTSGSAIPWWRKGSATDFYTQQVVIAEVICKLRVRVPSREFSFFLPLLLNNR